MTGRRKPTVTRTLTFFDVQPPPPKLLTMVKVDDTTWSRIPGTTRYRAVHACGWPLSSGDSLVRAVATKCARCKKWVRLP